MKIKLAILSLVLFVTPFVNAQDASTLPSKEISHTFYATGNLGTEKSNQNNYQKPTSHFLSNFI